MTITREHVDKALNEIERRFKSEIADCDTQDEAIEAAEGVKDKIDGMNATFMMIADNWPEVAYWINKGIEERDFMA